MYLSAFQTHVLSRVMTTLAEPHHERDIRSQVGQLMLDLLGAQHYASYVWDEAQQRFDGGVRINMDAANLAQYEQHYQYHDPITFKLQKHRQAVRVTDVMAQPQLLRTEFFNDFLKRDGLHWGVNLYAWRGSRNVGDMRIWRDKRGENFSRNDLELLDLVRPAFVAALCRSAAVTCDDDVVKDSVRTVGDCGALQLLSKREREIASLVAQGRCDKDIARGLAISVTTVRTHLDHAFRKLGVSNRLSLVRKLRL
jgi:DNA-binding CsgD family transcriptional regulator